MTDMLPSAAITYRLAGREYPIKRVVNCRTCTSPLRVEIEKEIVKGISYRSIARSLPDSANITDRREGDEEDDRIDRIVHNIAHHVRHDHMPHEITQWRATLEHRAKEIGIDVAEHQGYVGDHIGLARLTIQRALERLANGELQPDLKDAHSFAKLLQEFEATAGGQADQELYFQAFVVIWEAIQSEGSEVALRISRRIADNPVVLALRQRAAGQPIEATARG